MDYIEIQGITLKKYDDTYYVSKNGDIYSTRSKKFLKHGIDLDGYHRIDIHRKHQKVHKIVWITWQGEIPKGYQLNHKNDNKDDNSLSNLYLGTQKDNIGDCIKNKHRMGHFKSLVIKDKSTGKIITFPSVKDFIEYSGHSNKSNSFAKIKDKIWFKESYELISIEGVTTIESYKALREKYSKDA